MQFMNTRYLTIRHVTNKIPQKDGPRSRSHKPNFVNARTGQKQVRKVDYLILRTKQNSKHSNNGVARQKSKGNVQQQRALALKHERTNDEKMPAILWYDRHCD